MKKQLIVLSTLFVVVSSQCMYDRMKQQAQSAYGAAKTAISGAMQSPAAKNLATNAKALATGAMQSESGKLAAMQLKQAASDIMQGKTTDALNNMQTAARNIASAGKAAASSEQGKALFTGAKELASGAVKGAQANLALLKQDKQILNDAFSFKDKGSFNQANIDWFFAKKQQLLEDQPLSAADRAYAQEIITYWGAR